MRREMTGVIDELRAQLHPLYRILNAETRSEVDQLVQLAKLGAAIEAASGRISQPPRGPSKRTRRAVLEHVRQGEVVADRRSDHTHRPIARAPDLASSGVTPSAGAAQPPERVPLAGAPASTESTSILSEPGHAAIEPLAPEPIASVTRPAPVAITATPIARMATTAVAIPAESFTIANELASVPIPAEPSRILIRPAPVDPPRVAPQTGESDSALITASIKRELEFSASLAILRPAVTRAAEVEPRPAPVALQLAESVYGAMLQLLDRNSSSL